MESFNPPTTFLGRLKEWGCYPITFFFGLPAIVAWIIMTLYGRIATLILKKHPMDTK